MARAVSIDIVADSASRLVVGTYPAKAGIRQIFFGPGRPDRDADMIEAWDFDADAGVLRVVPAPGADTQERRVPLASLINLSWGGVQETRVGDEDSHYELRLLFDDGGQHGFLHLPGSANFLCASADQARKMERSLRAFLKPHCLRLESTTLENLIQFWKDPVEGIKSIEEKVGRRLAVLDNLSPPAESPGPDQPELAVKPDPAEPARELLTQLHSALGQFREAAAQQQRKRAESGGQLGGFGRLMHFLLYLGLGFLIGWWLIWK